MFRSESSMNRMQSMESKWLQRSLGVDSFHGHLCVPLWSSLGQMIILERRNAFDEGTVPIYSLLPRIVSV